MRIPGGGGSWAALEENRGCTEGRDGDPAVPGKRGGGGLGTAELCRALGARGWPPGEGQGEVPGRPAAAAPVGPRRTQGGSLGQCHQQDGGSCMGVTSHACSCMLLSFVLFFAEN